MRTLEARGLVKIFHSGSEDVAAVNGVDLHLSPGEFVMLMGPSGTGKTTLLSILGCILEPDAGELLVCGERIVWSESILPAYRRRYYGFIAQRSTLLTSLSVRENVQLPLQLAGLDRRQQVRRADEILEVVSLSQRSSFPVAVLSGGEKQRVAIARALAGRPPILLADEPTASLDSRTGAQVMQTLRQVTQEQGTSILLVTHDERLLAYGDRVYHMRDGQVHESAIQVNR